MATVVLLLSQFFIVLPIKETTGVATDKTKSVTSLNITESTKVIYGIDSSGHDTNIEDNLTTFFVHKKAKLLLYGTDLNMSRIGFTDAAYRSDNPSCSPPKDPKVVTVDLNEPVALAYVEVTFYQKYRKLFICLEKGEEWEHQGDGQWLAFAVHGVDLEPWIRLTLFCVLLCLSGMFSGLGLGLLTLDKNELKVLAERGNKSQKMHAQTIGPVRKHSNFLLCSLLLANVTVNATMPTLLYGFVSGYLALVVSTLTIVTLGEIIPQAICSRHGLIIGAKTIYLTYLVMLITSPLSYPISVLLDCLLGEEVTSGFDREALKEYIKITRQQNRLDDEEVNIIFGALELNKILVRDVMTELEHIYMVPSTAFLDIELVTEIIKHGYSRVPIYKRERNIVIGILYVKDLLLYFPVKNNPMPVELIAKIPKRPLLYLKENEQLLVALRKFKKAKCHLAFVTPKDSVHGKEEGIIGLITLEDVLEEILKAEIIDETDVILDNKKRELRRDAQIRGDLTAVLKRAEGHPASYFLSPQMVVAIRLFLASAIPAFGTKYISRSVLEKLVDQRLYHQVLVSEEPPHFTRKAETLYEMGKPADFFIMIVEGTVRIIIGQDKLTFEGKAFTYFGVSALTIADQSLNRLKNNTSTESKPDTELFDRFIPDYTVQIWDSCIYMKITQGVYLTACKATIRESKWDSKSSEPKSILSDKSQSITAPKTAVKAVKTRSKVSPRPVVKSKLTTPKQKKIKTIKR